ncbi:unnamed protein product, partial [Effrenium voratum]
MPHKADVSEMLGDWHYDTGMSYSISEMDGRPEFHEWDQRLCCKLPLCFGLHRDGHTDGHSELMDVLFFPFQRQRAKPHLGF